MSKAVPEQEPDADAEADRAMEAEEADAERRAEDDPETDALESVSDETEAEEVVQYVGIADSRTISVADWKQAGVASEDPQEVTWNAANNKTVPLAVLREFLTEDELNRTIVADRGFQVRKA